MEHMVEAEEGWMRVVKLMVKIVVEVAEIENVKAKDVKMDPLDWNVVNGRIFEREYCSILCTIWAV